MIVWDDAKRTANVAKHGLDFADVDALFLISALVVPARDGRYRAVGYLYGQAVTAIFKPIGSQGLSLISLRPASKEEREALG